MGIFNYVNFKITCPNCNKEVEDFQTKDFNDSAYFDTVEFWECNNFYSSCDYCKTWIEYNLERAHKRGIEDYKKTITPSRLEENQIKRNKKGKIIAIKGKGFTEEELKTIE